MLLFPPIVWAADTSSPQSLRLRSQPRIRRRERCGFYNPVRHNAVIEGHEDCRDALLWALRNEVSLGYKGENNVLAVDSAGGSLTAALGVRSGNVPAAKEGRVLKVEDLNSWSNTKVKGVVFNVPIT